MEWKLINIWDVVQTKTGVVGIVITKFTDHINLALHGHIQTILITDIEFKLGNIKSLNSIYFLFLNNIPARILKKKRSNRFILTMRKIL